MGQQPGASGNPNIGGNSQAHLIIEIPHQPPNQIVLYGKALTIG